MRLFAPMTLLVVVLLAFCLLAGIAIILRSARSDGQAAGICPKCGARIRPLAKFCSHCGADIGKPA